jgi:hypothetical protein
MAARQDQGMQVLVIVFVLASVVLAALSYFFYRSYSDADLRAEQAESRLQEAQATQQNLAAEKQEYQQMMGFDPDDNPTDVKAAFEEDMKRFGATFDEERRFYRDILEYIYEENEKIAAREATAKDLIKDLKDRLLAVESEKEKQVLQFKKRMEEAEEDRAAQRSQFAVDRKELEKTQDDLNEQVSQQRKAFETDMAKRDAEVNRLTTDNTNLKRALDNALERIPRSIDQFEVADGRVTWVNQNGTVWINLGSADALRHQVTFTVFDTDRQEDVGAKRKGSIEVTRVLGEHMAEARVTEDDATNPILTGDVIYSQVWTRGNKLHFALAGILDINGDGENDLKLAQELIHLNGGVVDAYVAEDGKVEGSMSVNTRYLVLGDYPEDAIKSDLRTGWDDLAKQASTLGVETITLHEFLNQMGYVPQERVVALDGSAPRGSLAAKAKDDLLPTGSSSLFRPRTPVSPPGKTPY